MTKELFEKAKFGDRFVTRGGQEALFLRLTENSRYQFADFYVKGWGLQRVNRENGKCLNGPDRENDIVGMVSSLPSNLDEAAEKYSNIPYNFGEFVETIYEFGDPVETIVDDKVFVKDAFKAGAEWMAGQGVRASASVGYYNQCGLSILTEPSIKKLGFKEGDELEITLRKK